MNPVVKLVGNSIGIASEWNANRKASKDSANTPIEQSGDTSDLVNSHGHADEDYDEEDWELDDAQPPPDYDDAFKGDDGVDPDKIITAFFSKYPQDHPSYLGSGPLPCPVVLPQRRPQTHGRGFVRAYAPVLGAANISQAMWLDFLQGFHKAIKMSPVFHAINGAVALAALGITIVSGPSPTIHFTALAVHTSIEAGRRVYTHRKTNVYLDEMNERLFKPRGLYALIMTYKPDSKAADLDVDLETNIASAVSTRYDPEHRPKIKMSSGKTRGEMQLPQEAAPLIYPGLDALPENQKKAKGALKPFLADYFDRRTQARFAADHPDNKLNVPQKEWVSRYSDPNHPASSGTMISLVTGGHVQGPRQRGVLGGGLGHGRRGGDGDGDSHETARPGEKKKGLTARIEKVVKEDVHYLMVVNLPSESEMAAAVSAVANASAK